MEEIRLGSQYILIHLILAITNLIDMMNINRINNIYVFGFSVYLPIPVKRQSIWEKNLSPEAKNWTNPVGFGLKLATVLFLEEGDTKVVR